MFQQVDRPIATHAQTNDGKIMIVTTANELERYKITRQLGVVRGLTVRSRSVLGNIGAGLQAMLGGNITLYTSMAEKAREEAYELLVAHAKQRGANAIIAITLRRERDHGRHYGSPGLRNGCGGGTNSNPITQTGIFSQADRSTRVSPRFVQVSGWFQAWSRSSHRVCNRLRSRLKISQHLSRDIDASSGRESICPRAR